MSILCCRTCGSIGASKARRLLERAPIGAAIHGFRALYDIDTRVDAEKAAKGEWREVDADFGYSAIVGLRTPAGYKISALLQLCGTPGPYPDYLALCGTVGALCLDGRTDVLKHFDHERNTWEDLATPRDITDALPRAENAAQRHWDQLFREYVADVRGEGYERYPTVNFASQHVA